MKVLASVLLLIGAMAAGATGLRGSRVTEVMGTDPQCPEHEFIAVSALSCKERNELENRLKEFYAFPVNSDVMDRPSPKFSPRHGNFITTNPELKPVPGTRANALLKAAGQKATDEYQKFYCKNFLSKHFPRLNCDQPQPPGRATREDDDSFEDLVAGWIPERAIVWSLDELPTQKQTQLPIWGDDYWALRWGSTSLRYAEGPEFDNYKQAIESYKQPDQWADLLKKGLDIKGLTAGVAKWSPAEKYDLAVGDEKFGLTNAEKMAGWDMRNSKGDVENWMGICDGWAGAAVMVEAPMKPVDVKGLNGIDVHFYPHDVRALTSLAWTKGDTETQNVGGRCNNKKAAKYRNGRLTQQECFDTNPATFHLALGNLIGIKGRSFVMDKSFDYEVWNQPILNYDFTYYNPLNTAQRSKKWKDVAVAYDDKFKAKDRFQRPLTRGARISKRRGANFKYNDKRIRQVVGVIATVSYLDESEPVAKDRPAENVVFRETYTYDLELSEVDGVLVAEGGEWHSNVHPDFLWVPSQGSSATTRYDRTPIRFTGKAVPEEVDGLAKTAAAASDKLGYPLCRVVKHLVDTSSGRATYSCLSDR